MTNKGILYYTDNRLNERYVVPVRKQLSSINIPIVCSSLQLIDWKVDAMVVRRDQPGYLTMFRQILDGLRLAKDIGIDVVFFAEHDVLYHPSHFEFTAARQDTFYYNQNVWKLDEKSGRALHYLCSQTSGLCAYVDLLIDHYEKRVDYVETNGFSRKIGFEPGTHKRIPELAGKSDVWLSEYPNVDIRHDNNLTASRWRKDQFRNSKYTKGWQESDSIPWWGKTDDIIP